VRLPVREIQRSTRTTAFRAGSAADLAIASSTSVTRSSAPGSRCPYRSRTTLTLVCPARTATSFGDAPAAIHSATALCRRSWSRSPS